MAHNYWPELRLTEATVLIRAWAGTTNSNKRVGCRKIEGKQMIRLAFSKKHADFLETPCFRGAQKSLGGSNSRRFGFHCWKRPLPSSVEATVTGRLIFKQMCLIFPPLPCLKNIFRSLSGSFFSCHPSRFAMVFASQVLRAPRRDLWWHGELGIQPFDRANPGGLAEDQEGLGKRFGKKPVAGVSKLVIVIFWCGKNRSKVAKQQVFFQVIGSFSKIGGFEVPNFAMVCGRILGYLFNERFPFRKELACGLLKLGPVNIDYLAYLLMGPTYYTVRLPVYKAASRLLGGQLPWSHLGWQRVHKVGPCWVQSHPKREGALTLIPNRLLRLLQQEHESARAGEGSAEAQPR